MSLHLTAQQVAAFPPVGGAYPQAHSFSPDGRYVACLWDKSGGAQRALWLYDRQEKTFTEAIAASHGLTADHTPDYEETMAREISRDRWLGIGRYQWAPDGKSILVLCANRLLSYQLESHSLSTYTHGGYIAFAAHSPQGDRVVFQADGDLWLLPATLGKPASCLTSSSRTVINGMADKVTREELFNQRAFWWHPDGQSLYFARYELADVPVVMVGSGLQDDAETIAYSCPGQPVSTFGLYQLDPESGDTACLYKPDAAWPYLVGAEVGADGQPTLHILNREQTCLRFIKGKQTLHEETNTPWLNVLGGPLWLEGESDYLFLHERGGHGCIARHRDGTATNLTRDCGHVERLLGLTPDKSAIYFIATGADPRSRHVFRVGLDGSNQRQLTASEGLHSVSFAPDKACWIHSYDTLGHPPRVWLERLDGTNEFEFPSVPHPLAPALAQRTPELFTLKAGDGQTDLYAALYKPQHARSAPLVVAVYGGPHVQVVKHSWALNADLRTQRLVDAGFYVLKVDNRGSSGRGIAFEKPVYGHLGAFEVDDQAAAVKAVLAREPAIDPQRVFVSGWSYGGYMTLMCLCRYPDIFKNGVSGAPVISWAEYDAQYTERYMGTPHSNPQGYASSSILPHVKNMTASPLLIHGMKDENVLFRNSGLLLEEAAQQGKTLYCLPLPRERHSASGSVARAYLEEQLFRFLTLQAGA